MMKKNCLLLAAAFLVSVNVIASETHVVADKKPFYAFDAVGPVISYTLLSQSSCVTTRTFTATITDVGDGVNTNPGLRPRVYYQRVGDGNVLIGNTNATLGWKYTEATNVGSTFAFIIDYSLLLGGVTSGQTIQYFVVAQDLNVTPNISINSGSFAMAPSSVALTATAFSVTGANMYNIINDLGNYIKVGPITGDYNAFTTSGGLFNAINNVGLSGNTIVEIVDPLVTENNAFALNPIANTGCGAGPVTLLIKPAATVTATLTGTKANEPIIRILSSNVTIDGSNNSTTSRNLTIQNTSSLGLVILYGSLSTVPINNATLKNTICISTINTTGAIVVSDGAGAASAGYFNNITIQNNSLQKSNIGVLCTAVPSAGNGSVLITDNDLNSTSTSQIGSLGIYTDGVDGAVITNNNIGNFEPAATTPRYGIQISSNSINSTISGNTISNISYSGSSNVITSGINISFGLAASNNNVTDNNISNITSSGSATVFGINAGAASGGITIQKNKISNIKNTNAAGYGAYGIGLSSSLPAANITVANNFIYDIAGFGLTTIARNGYGIYMGAGGGYKIYYNSVLMNTNQTNTGAGTSAALTINGVTTASSLDIRNNIFANTQTAGTPVASRYAIYSTNANTIFSNIDNNDYFSNGTNLGFLGGARTTLTDIQNGFGSNLNSLNVLPNFVSATDLHLLPASNCTLVGTAVPIAPFTGDIDNEVRDVQSPDIGADEFSRTMATPIACQTKVVAANGTTYVDGSCNRIARVLPSGMDPVSGSVKACVTYDATLQTFNGEPYVQRHYDIEPATGNESSTSATVTLYFSDADFVNYNNNTLPVWPRLPTSASGNLDPNRANVKITQFHGVATTSPSKPGFYPGTKLLIVPTPANVYWNGAYWAVTFDVMGFSGFYVHTNTITKPLPVIINYFTGRKQGSDHLLNWQVTCNSSPRATMILQRSADSRSYSDLYSITADALRCNQPFDYTDTDPLKGMNYYRLKVTDADGKISYSSVVALLNAVKGFEIISIAPNPVVSDNFKLNVASTQAGKMEIIIFDMQGRLVNRQSLLLSTGFNSLPVNVGNLAAGTYTIRAGMNDEQTKIIRFVKQ